MRQLISFFALSTLISTGACLQVLPGAAPTFNQDIAPLFQATCNNCHVQGGIAPFPLDNYQDAFENGFLIQALTESRLMPPWHIDSSGDCQTHKDARLLTEEEIQLVTDWFNAGMPEDDPTKPLPTIPPPVPDALDRVDTIAAMDVDYLPDANLSDDYRCFLIDPGLETDKFLSAYEVTPGAPTVVHHMVLFAVDTPEAQAEAEALDNEDPRPGYTCFGGSGVDDSRFVTAWAPGVPVQKFPDGTGLRLTAGRKLIMQVHYNTLAGILPDRTQLSLQLEDSVALEAQNGPIGDFDFVLSPGQEEVSTSADISLDDFPISVRAHAVFPHMHVLGQKMKIEAIDESGNSRCLVNVPDWDFHWQQFYLYENPVRVDPTETIRITCTYDTRGQTDPITFGEGTTDEMCLAFFYITL